MRKIRIHLVGMSDYSNFSRSFETLEMLGTATSHQFDENGVGWFVLKTSNPIKLVDKVLHAELPEVYVSIMEIAEKDNADDHNRA